MRNLLIACLFALFATSALAQSLTPGNPCGAAGVGRESDGRISAKPGKPGRHVDPDGGWTTCKMPKAPEPCNVPVPLRWSFGDFRCEHPGGIALEHGRQSQALQALAGPTTGVIILMCNNGTATPIVSACAQREFCVGGGSGYRGTYDGGQTHWLYQGRLERGKKDVARKEGDPKTTNPIECGLDGRFRLL